MDTSEHQSARLESGLGLRPHEFESRILRQLTRGNALSARFAGGAFSGFGQFLAQFPGRLGCSIRTLTDGGERPRATQVVTVSRGGVAHSDKAGAVCGL